MSEVTSSRGNGRSVPDEAPDRPTIPATDGVDRLVKQIDRLVERRQPGDPWWPVMLFTGEGRDAMLLGYQARLQRGGSSRSWRRLDPGRTSLVPHALRTDGARVGDWDFCDGLVNELDDFMPRRLGRFRAERYWTLRSVLDHAERSDPAGGTDGGAGSGGRKAAKRQLLNRLYSDHRGRQSIDGSTGDGGADGSGADGAGQVQQFFDQVIESVWGLPILAQLHRLVWKVGLRAGPTLLRVTRWRRMTWFVDRMSEAANRHFADFSTAALHLVDRQRSAADADPQLVRDLLVLALLHDFDEATRSSLVRPTRRRRSMPFVLLLREVGDGSTDAAHRFLDSLGRVRQRVGRATTLVLASMAPDVEVPASLAPEGRQVTAGELRDPARDVATEIAEAERADELLPALSIDVPTEPHDHASTAWLKAKTEVRPRRSRGTVAVPVVAMAVIGAATVVLGNAGVRWVQGDDPCPGIGQPAGSSERVGLSDGTTSCLFYRPEDADEGIQRELAEGGRAVEEMIAGANAAVAADRPHSTIVFLGPFTVPDEPEHPNQSTLRELRAIALAQHDLNELAGRDGKKLPVRVLLANTGDNIAHGPRVARQIVEAADDDASIVGVVGIGESRAKSREAIGILGEAGLPVIAGTATADGMVEASSLYLQVGPNNNRLAETMIRFAANYDLTDDAGQDDAAPDDDLGGDGGPDQEGPLRSGGGAVIVAAYDDEYSQNLAEDLKAHSTAADRAVKHTYFYVREGTVPASAGGDPVYVGSFSELAARVCDDLDPGRDVILFAGRSEQLVGLLDNMVNTSEGCDGGVTVVAGDDVTDLAQNPEFEREKYNFARLYYAAMASPAELAGSPGENFVAGYTALFGPDAAEDLRSDISDPALDYDALWALQDAVNDMRADEIAPERIDRDSVASRLTSSGIDFNGVSGQVLVEPSEPTGRVPRDKPVLILELDNVMGEPLLACGRFGSGDKRDRWGGPGPDHDAYPCPTDG